MFKMLTNFYRDERGYVPATEWMLAATILSLGSIAALMAMRYADDNAIDRPPLMVHLGSIQK